MVFAVVCLLSCITAPGDGQSDGRRVGWTVAGGLLGAAGGIVTTAAVLAVSGADITRDNASPWPGIVGMALGLTLGAVAGHAHNDYVKGGAMGAQVGAGVGLIADIIAASASGATPSRRCIHSLA